MSHVGIACLFHRVVVSVYDLVQILCDDFGDFVKLLVIELAIFDKFGKCDRSKIAHSHLIRSRVLNDFRAKVTGRDVTAVKNYNCIIINK